MNKEKYVFAQLVSFLNEDKFRYLVRKYGGNKYVKHFTCWNQLYATICVYCLVAIVQKDMQLKRSTYEVLQILSISLTDKTHLRDLFNKPKFQYDKELFDPNEPNLFNF